MSTVGKRLDRLEVLPRRGFNPDALDVRRIAEEVAGEFGVPVEDVLAEARAIAARGPRTVEAIADEVADELGLDRVLVRADAYAIWDEARRVRQ